jgi:hypothetical protein
MRTTLVLAAVAIVAFPAAVTAADRLDPYPLDTCAVAAKSKLGSMGDPIVIEHEGREIRFCCEKCTGKFKKEPEKYLAALDQRIVEQQKATYPLHTCVISGEELDEDAADVVVNNRLVRTCCQKCAGKVKTEPESYLAKVDAAIIEAQKKDYPLTTCPISGEELGGMGEPLDLVVGHRLVRLCCKGCKKGLKKDPVAVLAALDAAWAKKSPAKGEGDGKNPEKKPEMKPKIDTGSAKKGS